jgi:3-hydroxymyristoyl/3-hydroxydecanoyl-(acyl carrier protein) dehydratase
MADALPHAYPFRFVDVVLDRPGAVPEAGWAGRVSARVSANARGAMGEAWGSPLLLAEAIAQAALLLEGGDPEIGRRGFLAGIDGFEATRSPRAGESLAIAVKLSARFGAIVRFDGEVRAGEEILARGAVLVKRDEGGG